jgi:hypothetical protein
MSIFSIIDNIARGGKTPYVVTYNVDGSFPIQVVYARSESDAESRARKMIPYDDYSIAAISRMI